MARYTRSLKVAVSVDSLQQLLANTLETYNFEVIYTTEDYLMAREMPGQVAFAKLVIVEVLIDSTMTTNAATCLNFVIKNEELPLQSNNHCRQMFNLLSQAFEANKDWELVESISSV